MYLYEKKPNLFVRDVAEIFDKILDCISDKPVSVHKIVCLTSLHVRTVKKYIALIEKLQSLPKIKREIKDSRVLFRRVI